MVWGREGSKGERSVKVKSPEGGRLVDFLTAESGSMEGLECRLEERGSFW